MARKREERPPRKMKPVYIVFCEGETEETYINFLRQNYRSPIKIITNITGNEISSDFVQKKIDDVKIFTDENFTTFLMYDLDVSSVNSKLEKIAATKLLSNPCIELWFLLHSLKNPNSLTSAGCLQKLRQCGNEWKNYEKGRLTETQKKILWNRRLEAVANAKSLTESANPSSTVFRIIEKLEEGR
ncbi:MAG: RloB domain-containing protein [Treponema sp.]|nr:RloB domain-containing protein [Treponema sp.]